MISYQSLLPFGKQVDGVLEIKDSFSFVCPEDNGADCTLVTALCAYEGKAAPKIRFDLTAN